MPRINFTRWGSGHVAQSSGVPYLDLSGTDEPVEFLFRKDGCGLMARGNLQIVKGREKTGKSAAGIALMVAALKGCFLQIKPDRDDYTILWIDTEQDSSTLRERGKAALKMAGGVSTDDRLWIVALKGESPAERLRLTLEAIREKWPDLVFIDGAVDLCADFNDNKECASVVSELMKATEEYGCAILCVIHTNKKDEEARGHLGTILQQKCSEVYEVTKSGDGAVMRLQKSRFADISPVSFRFADGFMLEEPPTGAEKAYARKQELLAVFGRLFAEATEYTYKELCESYSEQEAVCKSAAQKAISEAVAFGILAKQGEKRETRYTYLFPSVQNKYEDVGEDL